MDTAEHDNYHGTHGDNGTRDAGQTCSDGILRAQARELIQRGKVPERLPERSWGGPGTGTPCMVCGAPVTSEETGLELEFTCDNTGDVSNQQFHVFCFRALESELGKLELARRAMASNSEMPSDAVPWPEGGHERS